MTTFPFKLFLFANSDPCALSDKCREKCRTQLVFVSLGGAHVWLRTRTKNQKQRGADKILTSRDALEVGVSKRPAGFAICGRRLTPHRTAHIIGTASSMAKSLGNWVGGTKVNLACVP